MTDINRMADYLVDRDGDRLDRLRSLRTQSGNTIAQVAAVLACSEWAIREVEQDQDPYLSVLRRYELAVLALATDNIRQRLRDAYTPEGVGIWLTSRNRNLGGRRPLDVVLSGEISTVEAEVERIVGGES